MAALKPKARPDLTVVEIEDEAVVYDPEAGVLHHLNPTAAILLQLCDGTGTVRELSEDIAEVLNLPLDRVLRQVRQVVKQFKDAGMLDGHARKTEVHTHG